MPFLQYFLGLQPGRTELKIIFPASNPVATKKYSPATTTPATTSSPSKKSKAKPQSKTKERPPPDTMELNEKEDMDRAVGAILKAGLDSPNSRLGAS